MVAACLSAASLAAAGAWSCSGSATAPSPVAIGTWGGDHIRLTVTATSAHVELDCAHGDISTTLETSSRGEFDAGGTFVKEHPGPIPAGTPEDSHQAVYTGALQATMLSLTIRLTDTSEVFGPFMLTRNAVGRVVKCL